MSLTYLINEPATTTFHRVYTGLSASWKTAFDMPRHGQPCRIPSLAHIFAPFPSLSLYNFRLQARRHTNVSKPHFHIIFATILLSVRDLSSQPRPRLRQNAFGRRRPETSRRGHH